MKCEKCKYWKHDKIYFEFAECSKLTKSSLLEVSLDEWNDKIETNRHFGCVEFKDLSDNGGT